MKLSRFLSLGVIVGPLPVTLINGTIADANDVMSNLQWIVDQVNANAGGAGSGQGKNILYNGAMQISQRFEGGTTTVTGGASQYSLDRWLIGEGAAGSSTCQQIGTTLDGFQYSAKVGRTVGNSDINPIFFCQSLESFDSIPMQGKTLMLSFYARNGADYSPAGSQLSASVITGTGTDQSILGYTGSTTVATTNVTLSSAWQRFTLPAVIPSSTTEMGVMFRMTPTGTAGANDYFQITGVQLEVGAAATAYDFLSYTQELSDCSRYFTKSFPRNIPLHNLAGVNGAVEYAVLVAGATQTAVHISFPTRMRIAPAISTYNTGAANANWRNATLGADSGSPTAWPTEWGVSLTNPQVGGDLVGNLCYIQWSADAEI